MPYISMVLTFIILNQTVKNPGFSILRDDIEVKYDIMNTNVYALRKERSI